LAPARTDAIKEHIRSSLGRGYDAFIHVLSETSQSCESFSHPARYRSWSIFPAFALSPLVWCQERPISNTSSARKLPNTQLRRWRWSLVSNRECSGKTLAARTSDTEKEEGQGTSTRQRSDSLCNILDRFRILSAQSRGPLRFPPCGRVY